MLKASGTARTNRQKAKKPKAKPVRSPATLPDNWRELPTLPLNQARLLLGLSLNAAYEAAKRKEIPVFRFGKLWRVPVPQLRRMIDGVPGSTSADLARSLRAQADLIEAHAGAGTEGP